jgi:hypothetical protein
MEENFKRLYSDNEENKPIIINLVLSQKEGGPLTFKCIKSSPYVQRETRQRHVPYFFDYMQGKF